MCVTLRNAIYFHLLPARRLTHPVCTHAAALAGTGPARCWLYGHPRPRTVCRQRCEPGTGDGKPGTRDGVSGTTGYGKPSTRDGKGTRDGDPEPGTRDQGAPGTADSRVRDSTSAGNDMDREPGTRDGKAWHP